MKLSANWLRDFVDYPPPLERIGERLTMAGIEVKKIEPTPDRRDSVLEIEITTNRSDWLSHWGIAREIAAIENLSLKAPSLESGARPMPSGWKVACRDLAGCPYYTGVYIEGLSWAPTPEWMRDRLTACGLRCIHLIVDITNYVLLETGQPLHAFDADLLQGQEVQIRKAKSAEKFVAINDIGYELHAQDLVIADATKAVALAGIMGGKESEVTERTRNVFLESAFFDPRLIRQSSRRYGLRTESSYRFERRVDPEMVDTARERVVRLIKQHAKPRFISGVLKAGQKPLGAKNRIHLSAAEVEKALGVKIKSHQITSILTRLGLDVKPGSSEISSVGIPSFRSDITRPIDLIEEVARIYGYENIPETLPAQPPLAVERDANLEMEEKARHFLTGLGFFETVTFSLVSKEGLDPEEDLKNAVSILNPQNQDLVWMRPTLLPSLLQAIQKNQRAGEEAVLIYEIANIYRQEPKAHPQERKVVGVALQGKWRKKNWLDSERRATFYDLKGVLEAWLKEIQIEDYRFDSSPKLFFKKTPSEGIVAGSKPLGFLGQVHPRLIRQWDLEGDVYYAELSIPAMASMDRGEKQFTELPRFPAVERDLALIVSEEVRAEEVERPIWKLGKGLIAKIFVFDIFRGGRLPKGYKNIAFRLTYRSPERTLLSEEIQKLHTEIAEALAQQFQATFQ